MYICTEKGRGGWGAGSRGVHNICWETYLTCASSFYDKMLDQGVGQEIMMQNVVVANNGDIEMQVKLD